MHPSLFNQLTHCSIHKWVPCLAFTPGRGPIGSLCMWAVEAVYCTLVVLTLGLCGRRSDGTYWGSYSKPSASPEVPYSQLLEA